MAAHRVRVSIANPNHAGFTVELGFEAIAARVGGRAGEHLLGHATQVDAIDTRAVAQAFSERPAVDDVQLRPAAVRELRGSIERRSAPVDPSVPTTTALNAASATGAL